MEYKSITDAAEKNNIHKTCICRVCKGKNKSAGGFIWQFKNKILSND
jgi:hypothetical protein